MIEVHEREKQQFRRLFEQEGIDRVEERCKVLEVFLETERHVSINDLSSMLVSAGYDLDDSFVEDTLDLMCRYGFAGRHMFEKGPELFEHRHLGRHHDHLICTRCGRIVEFENDHMEQLQLQIAARNGFHMLQHKLEIYGICDGCRKSQMLLKPLSAAEAGEKLVLREFDGGASFRGRLSSMGLRLGDRVEVISRLGRGQMVLAADDKRFVLGGGETSRIMVESRKQS